MVVGAAHGGGDSLQRALSRSPTLREGGDMQELQRAVIEKTHVRALESRRMVLLHTMTRGWRAVDMRRLSKSTKRVLLRHTYVEEEDEGLGFLARVRARMDAAGLPQSTVEVRFRNLAVEGRQVVVSSGSGSGAARTLAAILSVTPIPPPGSHWVPLVEGVSGVLKPGRLTLLLGHPGAGKTVLLKALAGQLRRDATLKVTADELSYNGRSLLGGPGGKGPNFVPERAAVFIPPLEAHFPELTVRQTLEFAARVHGSLFAEDLSRLEAREKELGIQPDSKIMSVMAALAADSQNSLVVDVLLRTLGMDECGDTVVGSVMLRGISGGQRKRLTTGEALTSSVKVLLADEISTGLDSATTHAMVANLRSVSRNLQVTQLICLLQPPPETVQLFDDVMLLSAGRLVFHGPYELLQPFFEGTLGFRCPMRKGVAEVVQELATSAGQEQYWETQRSSFHFPSAANMAEAFYKTEAGQAVQGELSKPFGREGWGGLPTRQYGAGLMLQLRACMARGWLLQRGQMYLIIGRILNNLVLGICAGTLFLDEPKGLQGLNLQAVVQSVSAIIGVCFFSVESGILSCFSDSAVFIAALPVWHKHKTGRYYPAVCFALPFVLLRLPWIFVETWIWTGLVYGLVGLAATAGHVLAFWAVLFALGVFMTTLFLATAAGARSMPATVAVEAGFMMVFVSCMGVIIAGSDIPRVWKAAYWSNPTQYILSALVVNEFTSDDWAQPNPLAPGTTVGESALNTRGFPASYAFVWVAIFAVGLGCSLLNFSAMVLFLTKLSGLREAVFVSEAALKQRQLMSGAASADTAITVEVTPAHGSKRQASLTSTVGSSKGCMPDGEAGVVLPFKPLAFTFRDVHYSVPFGKDVVPIGSGGSGGPHAGRLLLLRGISGTFRPGVLTALMGASGAGKTTLMDVLAGRKTGGRITGDLLLNGRPKEDATFARVSGYCEQQDIHSPYATVHEACLFSARLRLPADLSREVVDAFVLEQMRLVELDAIAGSLVGLPGTHLSTEQRKRLTIAVELVANPSIIFMDEPTSGLDARAASLVMRAVKNASRAGRTVVCTIHQPSLDVFEAFDELLLLQRGGTTIYNGPTSALISYFQGISGVPPIEAGVNPASWMLEVTSPEAERKSGADFALAFQDSELAREAQTVLEQCSQPTEEGGVSAGDVRVAGWLRQTWELTVRNFREYNRNLLYTAIRGAIMVAIAVVFATLFIGQGSKYTSFTGVLNVVGAMYSCCMFCGLTVSFMVQDVVSVRRTVFYRERAAHMYGCLPYFLAESAVELPWVAAKTLLFAVIVYFGIGFIEEAGKFWFFTLILFLILVMFNYFGMMWVHLTPNLELANAMLGFAFMLTNLFCGFLKTKPTFPKGWLWMFWLDPASYGLWGLTTSQLGDITNVKISVQPGMPAMSVAAFIENYFGFDRSFMWWTVAILVAFIIGFRLVSLLAIRLLTFQRR